MRGILFLAITLLFGCDNKPGTRGSEENNNVVKSQRESGPEKDAVFRKYPDGNSLFQEHCKICHSRLKKLIGPPLFMVRDRWTERTGSSRLIYEWVRGERNFAIGFIDSLQAYSPDSCASFPDMTVYEVNSILDYLEGY